MMPLMILEMESRRTKMPALVMYTQTRRRVCFVTLN